MFGMKKRASIRTASLILTPAGKDRVENMEGQGVEFRILTTLQERGPMTIREIDTAMTLGDVYKIEYMVKSLMQRGLVTAVKSQEI
jgi:predicted transcriptional regulator